MTSIQPGEAEFRKLRPGVVLSADGRTVVVAPLSTGPLARPLATHASVAVYDQVRAVDELRLARIAGTLSRSDLRAVEDAVRVVLQL